MYIIRLTKIFVFQQQVIKFVDNDNGNDNDDNNNDDDNGNSDSNGNNKDNGTQLQFTN